LSEAKSLSPRGPAVHPSLFIGASRVEGGERLRESPELSLPADALLDQESLESLTPPMAEEVKIKNFIRRSLKMCCSFKTCLSFTSLDSISRFFSTRA